MFTLFLPFVATRCLSKLDTQMQPERLELPRLADSKRIRGCPLPQPSDFPYAPFSCPPPYNNMQQLYYIIGLGSTYS